MTYFDGSWFRDIARAIEKHAEALDHVAEAIKYHGNMTSRPR